MKRIAQLLLGITLGFTFIWLVATISEHAKSPTHHEQAATRSRKPTTSTSHHQNNEQSTRRSEEIYLNITEKNKDATKTLSELSESELQSYILHMFSKTNLLDGLNHKDEDQIEKALDQLAITNLSATCQWIEQTFAAKTRNTFYKHIISTLFEEKPLEALDFAKQHLDKKNVSDVVGTLFITTDNLTTKITNSLIDNVTFDSGSTGTSASFSENFNFLEIAQKTIALIREHNGASPSSFPTNFYKEWATRNPSEAMEFYLTDLKDKNDNLPFNDLGNIIQGYLSVANTRESTPWLTDLLHPERLNDKDRKIAMAAILRHNTLSNSQLKELTSQHQRTSAQTLDFYSSVSIYFGSAESQARLHALQLFSSPASRIDSLVKKTETHLVSLRLHREDRLQELTQQLRTLGHTDADIARLTEARNQALIKLNE